MHLPAVFDDRKPTVVPLITLFYIRGMQIRWLYSRREDNKYCVFFLSHTCNQQIISNTPAFRFHLVSLIWRYLLLFFFFFSSSSYRFSLYCTKENRICPNFVCFYKNGNYRLKNSFHSHAKRLDCHVDFERRELLSLRKCHYAN